ncbi:DUF3987 domain-containing protein [Streptomyces chartreusis]
MSPVCSGTGVARLAGGACGRHGLLQPGTHSCCAPARRVHSVADRLHGPVQPASRAYESRLTALTPPAQISPSRSPSSALGRPDRHQVSGGDRARASPGRRAGPIDDWAGKCVGTVARIAGLLHLADRATGRWGEPIEATTIERAIAIGEYYTAHASAAFDLPKGVRVGCEPAAAHLRRASAASWNCAGQAVSAGRPRSHGREAADKAGEVEFDGTAPGQLLQDAANPWLQAGSCVRAVGLGAPSGAGGSVNRRGTWEGWSIAVLLTPPSHGPRADRK